MTVHEQVRKLEEDALRYKMLKQKIREDLGRFLDDWAEPETRLPKNRGAQVLPIARLLNFVGED